MVTKTELSWVDASIDTLPDQGKALHKAVRDAFEITKQAKAAFETYISDNMKALDVDALEDDKLADLVAGLQEGKALVFSYRRGLAVALAEPAKAKAAAKKGINLVG